MMTLKTAMRRALENARRAREGKEITERGTGSWGALTPSPVPASDRGHDARPPPVEARREEGPRASDSVESDVTSPPR